MVPTPPLTPTPSPGPPVSCHCGEDCSVCKGSQEICCCGSCDVAPCRPADGKCPSVPSAKDCENTTQCNTTDWCDFDDAYRQSTCQPRLAVGGPCFSLGMGLRCLSGHCEIDPSIPPNPRLGMQGKCVDPPSERGQNCTRHGETGMGSDCFWSTDWCDYGNAFSRATCQPREPDGGLCFSLGMGDRCKSGKCVIDPTIPPNPRLGAQGQCAANSDGGRE